MNGKSNMSTVYFKCVLRGVGPLQLISGKAFDLFWATIIKNQHTRLLSLFTKLQLWEMTNQYLIPAQVFALCEEKKNETKQNTIAHFTQTKSTLWVTVWISCLIKSSFFCLQWVERTGRIVVYSYYLFLPHRWNCCAKEECTIYQPVSSFSDFIMR